MTYNSSTENKEQNIPSQILKTIFGLHASVILDHNTCGLQYICRVLWSKPLLNSSGQLAELTVYITPPE